MHRLQDLLTTRWYWLGLVVLGVTMEAIALYYQYVVGDDPCQVCIHTRIWVAAFTLVGLLMCLAPQRPYLNIAGQLLVIISAAGMLERAWYLYLLENGKGDGSCEFFLGFPDWFALDRWFPLVFEVRTLCGYTPELLWGISMAEGLIAASVGLLLLTGWALVAGIRAQRNR